MSEHLDDPSVNSERVAELVRAGEQPSEQFLAQVLDGINTRQTTTSMIEVGWWGITGLLLEMLDTMFRALGIKRDEPEA